MDYPLAAADPRGCHQQPHLRVVEIIGTSADRIGAAIHSDLARAVETTRGRLHWFEGAIGAVVCRRRVGELLDQLKDSKLWPDTLVSEAIC